MLAPDQIDFLLKHFQIPLQVSALPCEAPQVGFSCPQTHKSSLSITFSPTLQKTNLPQYFFQMFDFKRKQKNPSMYG